MEGAELIAQSPILWHSEMDMGRWYSQENPLAVFWLHTAGLVVEVQARPRSVSSRQAATRAILWLKVTSLSDGSSRRIAVWTPHAMDRMNPDDEAISAAARMVEAQQLRSQEALCEGLVMMPAHGIENTRLIEDHGCTIQVVTLDAAGATLGSGLSATAKFVRDVLGNVEK